MDHRQEAIASIKISDAVYFFHEVDGFALRWKHVEALDAVAIYESTEIEGWHVLAFRGSEQRADWGVNFNVRPFAQLPGGTHAHRGYWQAWNQLKDNVLPKLAELNIRHLTVTGHSLGGALATLAATALEPEKLHLITFGNPKALGPKLAAVVDGAHRSWRYVHRNDICPLFPVDALAHVGKPIQLGTRPWWRFPFCGVDHHPDGYLKELTEP